MLNLKIAVYQFNPLVGDWTGNADKLITKAIEAQQNGCDLFISSELALCGYSPEDLLLRPDFYSQLSLQLERFKELSGITMLIGCPYRENDLNYNSVFVIRDGLILGRYDKSILPNYGVFDEARYFESGIEPFVFTCSGVKIGVLICEDVWQSAPALLAAKAGSELLCVLNASPYDIDKQNRRLRVANARVSETGLPLIYVNQYGAQDDLVFEGASFALNADQELIMQLPVFVEKLAYMDYIKTGKVIGTIEPENITTYPLEIESIYGALVIAVRDYINKNKFSGVVLGLSGGIDSALTLAIAYDALGPDRVMAVMMPSKYTADISVNDSRDMVKRLGIRYEEIAISPIFNQFQSQLDEVFNGLAKDTTEENLQARIRGTILMAISNKLGYLVLTTGNKSEMATGYATLYGDMAGGFAPLKDVLKTQVYQLSMWRNQISDIIPKRIITRAPSAELRENQTDQDTLPDYAILDQIITLLVDELCSCSEIIQRGFTPDVVYKVAHLLKVNEYKRHQAPVGPKISMRAFARDWRYPITNHFEY
ncbi:MAG: NAD+ synthase [Burkholderiales bacterium]|nr:NAD+ synthase [Burkholderiales bacterium]